MPPNKSHFVYIQIHSIQCKIWLICILGFPIFTEAVENLKPKKTFNEIESLPQTLIS